MNPENIHVCLQPLPGAIRAFARRMNSGRILIVVNASLAPDAQKKALAHELSHVQRNDFDSDAPVEVIEAGK